MRFLEKPNQMMILCNEEMCQIGGGGLFTEMGNAVGTFVAGVRNYFNCEISGCNRSGGRILGPTGNYYPGAY